MALTQETTRGVLGVPGGELLDPAPAQHRLRPVLPRPARRLQRRPRPHARLSAAAAALGPQRAQRLVPPHDSRARCRTRRRTRSSCTWRRPTTRSPTSATEIMVRSLGIPQVGPVVQSYYNIPEMSAPFDGSAMVESDAGFPPPPPFNIPPPDNNAHGAHARTVRRSRRRSMRSCAPAGTCRTSARDRVIRSESVRREA